MSAAAVIRPQVGPQEAFLACACDQAGFGGGAGSGKSMALTLGPIRWVDRPTFVAKLFRRTYPQLEGSLLPETAKIYPRAGATYNASKHAWTFPSGARVQLSHLQHTNSIQDHYGQPYQYLGLDEFVTFEAEQVRMLGGWLRSAEGIPSRLRWASNPVEDDKHWALALYAPWIYGALKPGSEKLSHYKGILARAGEILFVAPGPNNSETFSRTKTGAAGEMSRTFFPALLSDNKILLEADPTYVGRLRATGETNAKRLLEGDWFARDSGGAMFEQAWWDDSRVE